MNVIDDMFAWLTSLHWGDMRPADFDHLDIEQLVHGIENHYVGGVDQFVTDNT